MSNTGERESSPGGERPRRWWLSPLWATAAAIYTGQLAPFLIGPLTECGHCVANFARFFVFTPGVLAGHFVFQRVPSVLPQNDWFRFWVPGIVITTLIVGAATWITAYTKGWGRWVWLSVLVAMSALNALAFAAALRS
ncbi:MAG: hypothetical protein KDM64_04420 [Verrucomicrobiae bacterium]|nr:hypothetical protein [Verrucomicrobiae bacterium]